MESAVVAITHPSFSRIAQLRSQADGLQNAATAELAAQDVIFLTGKFKGRRGRIKHLHLECCPLGAHVLVYRLRGEGYRGYERFLDCQGEYASLNNLEFVK
jgi:hypothetical protein